MVTASPCRAMHPTHRGVYCEGTTGHTDDHHNLTDKALPVRAQRWAQHRLLGDVETSATYAGATTIPDLRPPRLKVNLRCIAGQHDTCPGHADAGGCGCPDPSHATIQTGTSWATSGADIAGDIAAAKAAVEAADDGLGYDVMPPAPEGFMRAPDPAPVELTAVEVKLITAAHLELRPTSALEAVRRILADRLAQ